MEQKRKIIKRSISVPTEKKVVPLVPVIIEPTTELTTESITDKNNCESIAELAEILRDYLVIHNSLWHMLPNAHIYYIHDGGKICSGYVRATTDTAITICDEQILFTNIRKLWKRRDKNNAIEWHLCANSLAVKDRQIADLGARVERLEKMLLAMMRQNIKV